MNEQAQQVLAEMLQRVLNGVDSAVEFSQAQIPDVVEQLLMWHMVESLAYAVLGMAILLSSFWMIYKGLLQSKSARKARKEGEDWTKWSKNSNDTSYEYDVKFLGLPFMIPSLVLFLVSTSLINLTWLQIWIAPKLYLLEYAAELVK